MGSPKKVAIVGKIWAEVTIFALNVICNLKLKVKGQENIPIMPFIVASKHQSDLETIVFHAILNKPVYVLKKELVKIPFFGIYLVKMGMIIIDRAGKMNALKAMLAATKLTIEDNRPVIIFPEGTRAKPNTEVSYHPGITALYNSEKYKILPVALNTGVFWAKNSFIKYPGTFTIEFLPCINPGLKKEEFNEILKSRIETASRNLIS
jgi:1-acyl-sn-glycerol-3-phosphate acyltransferase